jgi:hypothetical protein
VTALPLAADERLVAAFKRYEAAWAVKGYELTAARLELCEALLAVGETLAPELQAQMDEDRDALAAQVAISA